jgi:hypothetical protein
MRHTPEGRRILLNAEAVLFRHALAFLVDQVITDFEVETEAAIFVRLTQGEQLAMLDLVGNALLRLDVPCPALTAVSEGTVAAIYGQLRALVDFEIMRDEDMEEADDKETLGEIGRALDLGDLVKGKTTRQEILEACVDQLSDLPDENCRDRDEWDILIECLSDGVLWDADWQASETFQDLDPDIAQSVRDEMAISDNYFVAVAPEPSDEELHEIKVRIRELLVKIPG